MTVSDNQDATPAAAPGPSPLAARPPAAGPPKKLQHAWAPALLAAAIVLGLWGPNLVRPPPPAWTAFISVKGQSRRITLADKSVMRLNGATSVRVMFEDRVRRVEFEGGEAEFIIAPNARPFLMSVGRRGIRTRQADFNLRRYGRIGEVMASLTVRRGHIDVEQAGSKDPAHVLGPGDQLTWVDGQPESVQRKVDPNIAFAWQDRRLIYRQTPLKDVVTDLNRYVDRPISLAQSSLEDLKFTGVLNLDTENLMLRRLQAALPIQVQQQPAAIVLKPIGPSPARAGAKAAAVKPPAKAVQIIVKAAG